MGRRGGCRRKGGGEEAGGGDSIAFHNLNVNSPPPTPLHNSIILSKNPYLVLIVFSATVFPSSVALILIALNVLKIRLTSSFRGKLCS